MPKCSIIIPTYNRPKMLEEVSLASALDQSLFYKDYEIIVVDDCSSTAKENEEIVRKLHDKYKVVPIKYYRHLENKGISTARNTGIKYAEGDYLCFLDDDDFYSPYFLSMISTILDNFPQVNLAFSPRATMYKNHIKFEQITPIEKTTLYLPLDDGFLIRRKCFEKIMYDEEIYNEDADLGIQYFQNFDRNTIFTVANYFLFKNGHAQGSKDTVTFPTQKNCEGMERYLTKNLPYYFSNGDNEELAYIYFMAARLNYLAGNKKVGLSYAFKAFKQVKSLKRLIIFLISLRKLKYSIDKIQENG